MLRILIVEDNLQLAITLKYLVEDNPRYRVVATADDADTAIAAAEEHGPIWPFSTCIWPIAPQAFPSPSVSMSSVSPAFS